MQQEIICQARERKKMQRHNNYPPCAMANSMQGRLVYKNIETTLSLFMKVHLCWYKYDLKLHGKWHEGQIGLYKY